MRSVSRTLQKDRRDRSDQPDFTDQKRYALYARWLDHADAAIRANALICLIHQANYLLDRQIAALETAFISEGGYSEQLATERLRQRRLPRDRSGQSGPSDQNDPQPPKCLQCGSLMALRTAKAGKTPSIQFWGCTRYPECKGISPI